MFPDDTSVTTSEPTDSDAVKLVEEKSTNVSKEVIPRELLAILIDFHITS